MQIFLSYSSKDRELADQVHLALSAGGHQVFFDRDSLPPGGDYHSRIRNAVAASDLFVFLISRNSVSAGSYALTELKFARDKWAHPKRRVLPVLLEQMDFKQIPSYLTAVTVLEPEGNVSAETLDAVSEMVEMVNDAAMSAQTADKSTSNVTPDTKSAWTHNVTVPVLVAVIGMVGVLGAAAIANWDKLFGGSNGDPEEVDISMPDSTSAGAAFSMLTQIQRGEPATQRIKDYASRISGNDTTVPKLAVDWLPAPPATPHVRMPPVMVLTPTEANDYAEACAAHEDTYQDYPEGIGAVAFDACNWAFYGFTSEQWRAYEYYLRQIANYVEATRDHARVLAAIVASPSAPTILPLPTPTPPPDVHAWEIPWVVMTQDETAYYAEACAALKVTDLSDAAEVAASETLFPGLTEEIACNWEMYGYWPLHVPTIKAYFSDLALYVDNLLLHIDYLENVIEASSGDASVE